MIKFIYPRKIKVVTGGHRYEAHLQEVLKELADTQTLTVYESETLTRIQKLLSPLLSLKFLGNVKRGDTVIFNSSGGFYLLPLVWGLRILGKDTLVVHHHFMYEEFRGIKRLAYRVMENLMLYGARRRVTPSPYVRKLMEKRWDTELLPIPFEPREVTPRTIPGRLLYVGTIEPRKGLHLMLEGLMQRPERRNFDLHIIGKTVDEEYRHTLLQMARSADIRIKFHGMVGEEELNREMEQADIFLFPSKVEGFGMAMNEARFYGLPVIGFNTSAIPLSITDGVDGYLIPPFDTAAYGKAVAGLLDDRVMRSRMSQRSLERSRALPGEGVFLQGVKEIILGIKSRRVE